MAVLKARQEVWVHADLVKPVAPVAVAGRSSVEAVTANPVSETTVNPAALAVAVV